MDSPRVDDLNLKLGQSVLASDLDPIPRNRMRSNLPPEIPMFGYDLWRAFEASYLLPSGKPRVLQLQWRVAAQSPNMTESKSVKLCLNAFNQVRFPNDDEFVEKVAQLLSQCCQSPVSVLAREPTQQPCPLVLPGCLLDNLEPSQVTYQYNPNLLESDPQKGSFCFHSHLLRSNCPVTAQPDWGSVLVMGEGQQAPKPATLLAYLISFRQSGHFHEAICEQIYLDLFQRLQPQSLCVYCFYTRRGGVDINPARANFPDPEVLDGMVWRQ